MKSKDTIELTPEQISVVAQHVASQRSEAMEAFLEKQNRILDKQIAEQEEKERVEKEQRKQGALAQQRKRDEDIAKQNACPHIKPNRATAVAGQRDHSGNTHYICQLCSKPFTGNELPNWLTPDPVFIGGPIL